MFKERTWCTTWSAFRNIMLRSLPMMRDTCWQSDPSLLVSAPTASTSKKAISCNPSQQFQLKKLVFKSMQENEFSNQPRKSLLNHFVTELAVAFTVLMYLIQECGKQLLSHPAHLTQNQNSPVNFTNTSLLHQLNEGPSTNGLLILPLLQAASFFQMHKNSHFLFIQKQVAWRKFTY
jgi:hypothetical protein